MTLRAALVLAIVIFAGCASPAPSTSQGSGDLVLERLAGDDPAMRSLDAAPRYATGEWWRWRSVDAFSGEEHEITQVVAGAIGEHFLMGFPMSEKSEQDFYVTLHIPPFGEVTRENLSYPLHNFDFGLLRFPVVDGATWRSHFEFEDVNVSIERVNDTIAIARADGPFPVEAEYDAQLGTFRRMDIGSYGSFEVIEHGRGFEGALRVLSNEKFVWISGRALGPFDGPTRPSAPLASAVVEEGFDRVSVNVLLGEFLSTPGSPGFYQERDTAPDGQVFEFSVGPVNAPFQMFIYGKDKPAGTWSFEHIAGGGGLAATEGVAYESFDVMLPQLTAIRTPS